VLEVLRRPVATSVQPEPRAGAHVGRTWEHALAREVADPRTRVVAPDVREMPLDGGISFVVASSRALPERARARPVGRRAEYRPHRRRRPRDRRAPHRTSGHDRNDVHDTTAGSSTSSSRWRRRRTRSPSPRERTRRGRDRETPPRSEALSKIITSSSSDVSLAHRRPRHAMSSARSLTQWSFASTRRTTISEPEVSGTPRPRHDDERRSLEARSSTTRGRLAPQRRRTRSRRRSTTNSITSRRSPAADDEPRRATGRFIHERLDPSPSASTTRFEEAPTCRRILALDTESEERAQRVQLGKRSTTTRSQHRMPGRTRSHDPVAGRLVTFVHGQAAPGPTRTSSPTRASRRTAPPAQAAVLVHSTLFVVAQP